MKKCELCGAEVPKSKDSCPRCGFEFQKEIRSDMRDKAILKKHEGKTVENVKRDLKNRQAQLTAYLDNITARRLSHEEMVSLLDEALTFLNIPLNMGVDDELKIDKEEGEFITLVAHHLEDMDAASPVPTGTGRTYIRLSNAFSCMGEAVKATAMIERALLINPKDDDALLAKAKLLFDARDYSGAKKYLEKVMGTGNAEKARYLLELIEQISQDSP